LRVTAGALRALGDVWHDHVIEIAARMKRVHVDAIGDCAARAQHPRTHRSQVDRHLGIGDRARLVFKG
jgi:hypothetical protein